MHSKWKPWAQVWPYVKQLRQWVKQRRRQGGAAPSGRAAAVQSPADPGIAPKQQGHRSEPVQQGAVTTHVQVSEFKSALPCSRSAADGCWDCLAEWHAFSWQAGCICPGAELDCALCLEGFLLVVSRVCVPLLTLMFIVPGATGARPGVAELSLQPRRHLAAPANCPVAVRLRCRDPGSTLLLRAIFECIAVAKLLQKVFYHNAAEAACPHLFCHQQCIALDTSWQLVKPKYTPLQQQFE